MYFFPAVNRFMVASILLVIRCLPYARIAFANSANIYQKMFYINKLYFALFPVIK